MNILNPQEPSVTNSGGAVPIEAADRAGWRVAVQGEPGCFSETAARRLLPSPAVAFRPSFEDVAREVADGRADYGVLPVGNSLYGEVLEIDPLLQGHDLVRIRELSMSIRQCLIAAFPVRVEDVREVRSHPVALGQCRRFLSEHPWMRPVEVADTAGAVREVCAARRADLAAIAGPAAAELYGAALLRDGIADSADNLTRFVLFERRR